MKIVVSMTGVGIFAAMLVVVEIVDIKKFSTPWKLVSHAGLAPASENRPERRKRAK